MKQICKPLQDYLDIKEFTYERIYRNHSKIKLTNQPDWIEYLYTNFFHLECDVKNHTLQTGVHLTQFMGDDYIFQQCQHGFDIGQGVLLIEQCDEYKEFYWITTSHKSRHSPNTFLQNLDKLKMFIHYFKERAKFIIDGTETDRIIMPHLEKPFEVTVSDPEFEQFLQQIKVKSFSFGKLNLTPAELKCALGLIEGRTVREIAISQCRSQRTIETHVEHLKQKTAATSKAELIKCLLDSGVGPYLHQYLRGK